jgi:hypothetical protein
LPRVREEKGVVFSKVSRLFPFLEKYDREIQSRVLYSEAVDLLRKGEYLLAKSKLREGLKSGYLSLKGSLLLTMLFTLGGGFTLWFINRLIALVNLSRSLLVKAYTN